MKKKKKKKKKEKKILQKRFQAPHSLTPYETKL